MEDLTFPQEEEEVEDLTFILEQEEGTKNNFEVDQGEEIYDLSPAEDSNDYQDPGYYNISVNQLYISKYLFNEYDNNFTSCNIVTLRLNLYIERNKSKI